MSATYKGLRLSNPNCTFDDCLIGSLLKKIFATNKGEKEAPVVNTYKQIAKAKNDLELFKDHLAPELSYECLALLERSLADASFRYVVISKANTPILFAYYQIFTLTSSNFNLDNNNRFLKGILRFFVDLKKAKAVVLGNVLRNETQSYCYNTSEFTVDEATEVVAGIAEKIAAEECATAIILKELPELSATAQQLLAANGYRIPFEDKVMDMAIDSSWLTLSDYINALSRKYKARANKALAAIKDLEVKLLSESEISAHEQDIYQLFTATVKQQSFTLTQPQAGYFSELKRLFKDSFEVVGFMKDGRIVAFYTAFVGSDYYNIYYVGFNYELNNTYQLYFNILFSGLERSILAGKQTLQLGRTSFDAKASLGAQARTLNYFIKMEYIPDFVIQWFVKYFSSMENSKWKQRNPLKEGSVS